MTAMKTANNGTSGFLATNDFGGSQVPTEIGMMTEFTSMGYGLYASKFGGTVPSELGSFSMITKDFRLNNNEHTGTIPTQLGQVPAT